MGYIFQPARHELLEQIKRHASVVRGRVLDVGAGSYARYQHLFIYDQYVKLDREGISGIDVVGSLEAIPLPDASFDSVVCTQVVGDVYNLPLAFSEFFRVLRPGGTLLLTESFVDSLHDEPYDYWRITKHSLRRLSEDAGFTVQTIESRGGFWSVRAQMYIRYLINRFDIQNRMYARAFNVLATLYGRIALWRDKKDAHRDILYTLGYILIAVK